MKKKVIFLVSSFSAGGAERVFWLISQAFDKERFEVVVVLLSTKAGGFPLNLKSIRVVDLKTTKASSSFFSLLSLMKKEKPYVVYSTGGEINVLISIVSWFCKIPLLIARGTNIPEERYKYHGFKSKLLSKVAILSFRRFDYIVCQSKEMFNSWAAKSVIGREKLVIIPNPVTKVGKISVREVVTEEKKLIIVARLSSVKGHIRLLDVIRDLPEVYKLTIAGGDGGMKSLVRERVDELGLQERVSMKGEINDALSALREHDLLVLSSYTEGFPNVVLEALSVGVPVVTFRVGGVTDFIINGFNGYIVEQGDLASFRNCVVKACNQTWDHRSIASDIYNRFSIHKVVKQYEQLIA